MTWIPGRHDTLRVDLHDLCTHVVLAHAARHALLTLVCDDGRRVPVSHDLAFRPVLSPCLLRRAVVEHLHLGPGQAAWLSHIVGLEVGGPFVEPLDDGVLVHHAARSEHVFATSLGHERVHGLLHACRPEDDAADAIDVHLCVDTELGVTAVRCSTGVAHVTGAVRATVLRVARACRREERLTAV